MNLLFISKLIGSDLDGDEYHIIWYEDFFFGRENVPAMSYAIADESTGEKDKFTVIFFFFCLYYFIQDFFEIL